MSASLFTSLLLFFVVLFIVWRYYQAHFRQRPTARRMRLSWTWRRLPIAILIPAFLGCASSSAARNYNRGETLPAVSPQAEKVITEQTGRFALLLVVDAEGRVTPLRSNKVQGAILESFTPVPAKTIKSLDSEAQMTFEGSYCILRKIGGRYVWINVTGGPISECYQ